MALDDTLTPEALMRLIMAGQPPLILDARRDAVFAEAPTVLPAARRLPGPAGHGIVAYCVHGHAVSQRVAAELRAAGHDAAWLSGGIAGWEAAGLPLVARAPDAAARFGAGMVWVTRRRPKIDRVACPWFIRRFVDPCARFLFVEPEAVLPVAAETGGISLDTPESEVTHDGDRCSFDTLLDRYAITDPVLRRIALIVRGADTARPDLAPEAAGLLAISLGISATEADDRQMLVRGFALYDALHAWARLAQTETHSWPPKA